MNEMTDREFAAYIDKVYAACNHSDLPPTAQYWTPEMIVEMYVSATIDLSPIQGTPDYEGMTEFLGILMNVQVYEEDDPPPLVPAQQARLDAATQAAKASYWRGKLEGTSN